MNKIFKFISGGLCGFINGLFGSGGGLVAVPVLQKSGFEAKKAHASSVFLILTISITSSLIYGSTDSSYIITAMDYIPYGLIGAVIGAILIKKINNDIIRRIFGVIILISAVRIFIR